MALPIFSRSESPNQVFLILIQWLLSLLKESENPGDRLSRVVVAYDNMCNLDRMKVAQNPLPFQPPYDKCWLSIGKIVDKFHHRNHVSEVCKVHYSPDLIKTSNPNYNTQAGEQTFSWVGRYKYILCAMNKIHHLFYLHRMVKRRNMYTEKCYLYGRKPLLPKSKK